MFDIKWVENNLEAFNKSLEMRGVSTDVTSELLELNAKRKEMTTKVETTQSEIKKISKEVGAKKKMGEDATELMSDVHTLKNSVVTIGDELEEVEKSLHHKLSIIPNMLAPDTPIGRDESENIEISKWGSPKDFDFKVLDHVELGENNKLLDFESAAKMTGARFAVYKGAIARLERALANFMLDHQADRGYTEIIPPFIVHEKALFGTGQLPKFKEDLFKIEGQDWYLIPTSEVPLTNIKRDEIFDISELPFKFTGLTPCFRSEAGSHGRDTKGLIRMHQFNKVEMVNIVHPDDSDKALDEMLRSAQEILEKLELPYRTVRLCTGDIGFGATKTFDIEVWVPSQDTYREISSCSNCIDFQARRAKIRFKKQGEKPQFAHTLNGSGLAVGRCLVAIMENYQNADGSITVPKALVSYMGGLEIIK